MTKPAEAVWKQQLQRFDLLRWVFQRCYSLVSYIFLSVSGFYHWVTKSVCGDGFWAPMFLNFFCYCKNGTLCELVCRHLFFLFHQNSCFSFSFNDLEKFFAPTHIIYASVSDIKSMNSVAYTPWAFPKRPLALIPPDHMSRISKKVWNFFLCLKKVSSRKRNCWKIIPQPRWMDDSKYLKDYESQTTEC